MSDKLLVTRPGDPGYIYPGSDEYALVIGCSQVGTILGHGYESPNDLWLKKTHRSPQTEHKRIFDRGHSMEPQMAQMLERDFGRVVRSEQVQYRDPDRPWLVFHADGMFPSHSRLTENDKDREGPGVWEAKAPGSHMVDKFRREGMTPAYICQLQIGMHVAGAALGIPIQWGTAGFLDYDEWELLAFDVDADWEFQKRALRKLEQFHQCLVNDTPPDPMMNEDLPPLPEVIGGIQTIDNERVVELATKLAQLQPSLEMAKQADKQIRDELKVLLRPYEAGEVPGLMSFSYKYGKPRMTVNGEGLLEYARWLAKQAGVEFDETPFVKSSAPSRSFRPKLIGE